MRNLLKYAKPTYAKVLLGLLKEEEMTFKQIYLLVGNRNAVRHRLDDLIRDGYVNDLRTNVERGQVGRFVLTDNGYRLVLDIISGDLNAALRAVKGIMEIIVKYPSKIGKWQRGRKKALFSLRIPPTISVEQKGDLVKEHFSQHQARWDRPMLDCLRAVHEVFLSTDERAPGAGSLIGITKVGAAYTVRVVPENQVPELFPETADSSPRIGMSH